ncbi:MAG: Light-repressed protein A, partial [Acaryochloridaceae cyanobacterium RL_2_7]|nr:Light-repressed protein A [Acaryochloridaceae cyanobacterium RL_2_7]
TKSSEILAEEPTLIGDLVADREVELPKEVVRCKYFAMQPMEVSEALEHLDMVDHDFYVFHNAETDTINVIYERNHGGFGLIQPRPAGAESQNNDTSLPAAS